MSVGRNEPCPCGSRKKYKKCCGLEKVVSLDSLWLEELHKIQVFFVQNFTKEYEDDIMSLAMDLLEDYDIPDEIREIFTFLVTVDMSTNTDQEEEESAFDYFINYQLPKNLRGRTIDTLVKWIDCRPSIVQLQEIQKDRLIGTDLGTDQIVHIRATQSDEKEEFAHYTPGTLLFGTLLPLNDQESTYFLAPMATPPVNSIREFLEDNSQANGEVGSLSDGIQENFLLLYLEILSAHSHDVIDINEIEWPTQKHYNVAAAFEDMMSDQPVPPELIETGLMVWHMYCVEVNPTIQKEAIYIASLLYFIDHLEGAPKIFTYSQLGYLFKVGPGSIKKRYHELKELFDEMVEQAR
ncbi:hypothetical protein Q73_13255 [Bacillus coahuilensis m2-6]|uniref:YecA family protein n=1 Tax=Bacillus coahuilensis TaxID=408580 RepID=UPI00075064CE|nr:SEC-C metal-binding domain-containing protein [Bacillus coahuilensis]KUP05393.1 hypothetical protein Q73_13255 [Bacillus coahuilensis m2-6]